eukprot:16440401-Heterocapsa_arctica.AAC.1
MQHSARMSRGPLNEPRRRGSQRPPRLVWVWAHGSTRPPRRKAAAQVANRRRSAILQARERPARHADEPHRLDDLSPFLYYCGPPRRERLRGGDRRLPLGVAGADHVR